MRYWMQFKFHLSVWMLLRVADNTLTSTQQTYHRTVLHVTCCNQKAAMSATIFKTSRDVISFLCRRFSTDSASSHFLPTDDACIRIIRWVPYVKVVLWI